MDLLRLSQLHVSEDYEVGESSDSCDRLSELPDSLLINEILSLLEMEDVVRTTILSKRWKDLWTTVSCLNFRCDLYQSFIEGALVKWKGTKILKFSIGLLQYFPSSSGILDSWLLVAIEKQVEDLDLNLRTYMDPYYCPPQRLYSCSSLTKLFLYLAYCDLELQENVQWYKLKTLTIESPISLSDDAMHRILSGAPLLEELVLWTLDIYENFNIRSTSLKILEIGSSNCTSARTVVQAMLRIWAPNLLSLEISGCVYDTCLLDVPSLTNVTLCFHDKCHARCEYMFEEDFPPLEMFDKMFRSISHSEKVTLSSLCIQFLLRTKEEYDMITFSNTKFLKFSARDAKGMLDVLEMFPQLITLHVKLRDEDYYQYPFQCEMSEVDVFQSLTSPALHQLKTVEISWYAYNNSILPAIEILLHNACVLEKMVVRPNYTLRYDRELWLNAKEKVLSMPRSSATAKVIAIE